MVPCLTSAFIRASSARPRAAWVCGSSVERDVGSIQARLCVPATVGRVGRYVNTGQRDQDKPRGRVRVTAPRGKGDQMAIVPDVSRLNSSNQRLDELAALPANWDSYGAPPLSATAIQQARRALLA